PSSSAPAPEGPRGLAASVHSRPRGDHLASPVVTSLSHWLTPLLDAETMRGVDRWAIDERGVAGLGLMGGAGAGGVGARGNNGGEGLVVGRLLREAARAVSVVCVADPGEFKGDASTNLERLPGPPPVRPDGGAWDAEPAAAGQGGAVPDGEGPLAGAAVIVDALLGTGFEGEPRGAVAQAVDEINRADGQVVSGDVPGGVDASTGVVAGSAVRATVTVTFHAAKPGLWIRPGKAHAGEVRCVDIGIPRGAPGVASIGLIEPSVLATLPRREAAGTKFVSGHVLVAGGSLGLTGAPAMAARASMR